MTYQLDTNYRDEDKARVNAGFAAYAVQNNVPPRSCQNFVYRDESGVCIACLEMLVAGTQGYIKTLWVDDAHRGQGLAKDLMRKAEDFAIEQHFSDLFVDTFAFQAPEFYKKCGYTIIAEVPDYIAGHARVFLRKPLI